MFKTKKTINIILVLSLLLILFGTFPVNADELAIINGNLDEVTPTPRPEGWSVFAGGGTLLSDNTIKRGNEGYSVKFSNYTDTATLRGTVTGLEIGKMYTVSAWYYVEEAPESGTADIDLYSFVSHAGGDPTKPTLDRITVDKSFVDGKWRLIRHTFVCDSIEDSRIALYTKGSGFTIYVDDFNIEPEDNLLAYGGYRTQTKSSVDYNFELDMPNGIYGWVINDTKGEPNVAAVYDDSDPIEGEYSLKLTKLQDENNGIHKMIQRGILQKGVQYKLSYKIKALPVT